MKKILALIGLMVFGGAVYAQSTVTLTPPDILGVSCGGYQSGSSVTIVGFDTNGNIQASLTEVMSCSAGGRGGHSTRYTGSGNITFDFNGGYVTSWNAALAIPAVGGVATDSYGNVVTLGNHNFLQLTLTINQLPPNPVYLEAVVPNVVGLTPDAASAVITAAGLVPNWYVDANATGLAAPGIVFSQTLGAGPAAGAEAPFGSSVSFWSTPAAPVSTGGSGGHHHCTVNCNDD
jgi:hypothetical protein